MTLIALLPAETIDVFVIYDISNIITATKSNPSY